MKTTVPDPFKTVEDAKGNVDAFVHKLVDILSDEINDFSEDFVSRSRPELAEFFALLAEADGKGFSIDALEERPEYELFYAEQSIVTQHIIGRVAAEFASNIYGSVQHRVHQRERAVIGAP